MNYVIALIKDHKLTEVTHALHGVDGLTGMTASSVRGFGRPRHGAGDPSITGQLELLTQRVRIDLFCCDDRIEAVVETICSAAHTGSAETARSMSSPWTTPSGSRRVSGASALSRHVLAGKWERPNAIRSEVGAFVRDVPRAARLHPACIPTGKHQRSRTLGREACGFRETRKA